MVVDTANDTVNTIAMAEEVADGTMKGGIMEVVANDTENTIAMGE